MILLDTNVWSEAMKPSPDERVKRWAAEHSRSFWMCTVVIGELLSGAEFLPDGRRKQAILAGYEALIAAHGQRIAGFDLESARLYAVILATQTRLGRSAGTADTQIAAIARSKGFALATRNVRHFEGLGLDLIDPWAGGRLE